MPKKHLHKRGFVPNLYIVKYRISKAKQHLDSTC